jgi:hypothetical protein
LEAAIGIEPMNKGFADLCLTTWLRRHTGKNKVEGGKMKQHLLESQSAFVLHPPAFILISWSGRRDLNSRPSPWQGDALPLSYSRFLRKPNKNAVFKVVERNVPLFVPLSQT